MECFRKYDDRGGPDKYTVPLEFRYKPQKIETEPRSAKAKGETDHKTPARVTPMKFFRLSDRATFQEHVYILFLLLQQTAVKKIAKAWIKGICPKKQARYPYRSKEQKMGEDLDYAIPDWWPICSCRHIEPDHVNKDSRMHLCMHLLLLRPSAEQMKQWNGDFQGPNKTLTTRGWTAFLRELTPFTILDGLGKGPESEEKIKVRQKILNEIYDLAEAEEAFRKGERDDDLIYHKDYEGTAELLNKKSSIKKRAADTTESSASDVGGLPQKKSKQAAVGTKKRGSANVGKFGTMNLRDRNGPRSPFTSTTPGQAHQPRARRSRCKPTKRSNGQLMQSMGNLPTHTPPEIMTHWTSMNPSASSQESSPLTLSFSSSNSSQEDVNEPFQFFGAPAQFPGQQDFKFQQVRHVQEPQLYFERTVPNTPIMSPTKLTGFPRDSVWPGEYHIAPAMERYPGPLSTAYLPLRPAPVPAPHLPMLASNMPYPEGPFMDHYDRRSNTPGSDVSSSYKSFPHGLPVYRRDYPSPDESGPPPPFEYPEPTPVANFPAAALPASVVRGFTGNKSGVGGGAWT